MRLQRALIAWFCVSAVTPVLADHLVVTELRVKVGNVTNAQGCSFGTHPADSIRIVGVASSQAGELLPFAWSKNVSELLPLLGKDLHGQAFALNSVNTIVGESENAGPSDQPIAKVTRSRFDGAEARLLAQDEQRLPRHAVRWDSVDKKYAVTLLGAPQNNLESAALAVNDNGLAVGSTETAASGDYQYFKITTATAEPGQPPPAPTTEVVTVTRPLRHAIRWDNTGQATDLSAGLTGTESVATSINNNGLIVGWQEQGDAVSETRGGQARLRPRIHAVQWSGDGTFTELHTLDGALSAATDINDNNQVVGWVSAAPKRQAFIYEIDANGNGAMRLLDPANTQTASEANSINNDGAVVGSLLTGDEFEEKQAFIWKNTEGLRIINEKLGKENILVVDGVEQFQWNVTDAYGIDEKGAVIGCATNPVLQRTSPVIISEANVDLVLNAEATPNPVTAGNILRYNVAVGNPGPHVATEVTLHVQLPKGVKYLYSQTQFEGSCQRTGLNLTCRLGDMLAQSVNLVQVRLEAETAGRLLFTANVTTDEQEVNMDNNSSRMHINVDACFIATAAYGSYLEPHVQSLRRFRDHVLRPLPGGEWLIAQYYRLSPPLAAYIGERPWAKQVTRALLTPLVLSIRFPWLVLILAAAIMLRRRRKRAAGMTHSRPALSGATPSP